MRELAELLSTPAAVLPESRAFVLVGKGGSGKTHGLIDVALAALKEQRLTCVLFGHQFNGQPALWSRISETLGFSSVTDKDALLGALNAAGQASGLDSQGRLCMNNMHVIVPLIDATDVNFYLGLLNSKLMNWYYQSLNPEAGEALAEVKKTNVAALPVLPKADPELSQLVSSMLSAKAEEIGAEGRRAAEHWSRR